MNDFQKAGDVAATVVDRWRWWQSALANPGEIGKSLKMAPDSPEQGYFRVRYKNDQPWQPVAIWWDEETGRWIAYRSGREVEADALWNWCCRYPVSYEAYERAMNGDGWADDEPVVAKQIGKGHNSGDIDEAEQIRDQIEAAKKGADAYQKITDDKTLAKAQSLRARLNELARDADKKREALKRPHLEAGKAIDKEWQPIIKDAKAAADQVRSAMSAYETEKLRKQREAERKAEEARQKAEAANQPAPEPTPAPPAAPTSIKGSYGKAANVKVRNVVTGITNPFDLFRFVCTEPEMEPLLMKLAQRAVDAGKTVPGVVVEEAADVR